MAEHFDPRFDPAFQAGYDPKDDIPAGRKRSPSAANEFDGIASPGQIDRDGIDAAGRSEPTGVQLEPAEANPFEPMLWIVAAVLVVVGAAATFWANSVAFSRPGSMLEWQQILQSSAWALSTPMITVGLGTGVGLLFRRALAWDTAAENDAVVGDKFVTPP